MSVKDYYNGDEMNCVKCGNEDTGHLITDSTPNGFYICYHCGYKWSNKLGSVGSKDMKESIQETREINKEIQVILDTGSIIFTGHYRTDLERPNWHYYETSEGDLLHFRKERMIGVIERPNFNHIEFIRGK